MPPRKSPSKYTINNNIFDYFKSNRLIVVMAITALICAGSFCLNDKNEEQYVPKISKKNPKNKLNKNSHQPKAIPETTREQLKNIFKIIASLGLSPEGQHKKEELPQKHDNQMSKKEELCISVATMPQNPSHEKAYKIALHFCELYYNEPKTCDDPYNTKKEIKGVLSKLLEKEEGGGKNIRNIKLIDLTLRKFAYLEFFEKFDNKYAKHEIYSNKEAMDLYDEIYNKIKKELLGRDEGNFNEKLAETIESEVINRINDLQTSIEYKGYLHIKLKYIENYIKEIERLRGYKQNHLEIELAALAEKYDQELPIPPIIYKDD